MRKIGDYYQYSGAVHIHTTESDGTKRIEDVISIGQDAKLDFMMFTDHMTLSNRENGHEGLYGKMLVVIGYEHNDEADEHHYLLFDSPKVYPTEMSASEYVAAGAKDNALGILAHPDEIRSHLDEFPPYPWRDWNAVGFNGVELWNQMSEWMEKLTKYNKLPMSLSPRKSMVGPTDRILKIWDEYNIKSKMAGIAGVDAHAFPVKVGQFTIEIFPYKVHFRCLRTHIILLEKMSDDFETAKKQLYDAISDCRVYISNTRWGNADNFEFYAKNDSEKVTIGGTLSNKDDAVLTAKIPSKTTIKLVQNGKYILETITAYLEYSDIQSGVYRIEAWKGKRGWIFSNHIRVS